MKRLFSLCLILCLLLSCARGDWYCFSDKVPDSLGFVVNEASGNVTITFLGDCTLGSVEKAAKRGFNKVIQSKGYAYPFKNLLTLTSSDDITVANLEGVLTDRNLTKEIKTYNFKGPTAYTKILTLGSVECVGLANNHSYDYGSAGRKDTVAALNKADIAHFNTDSVAIWQQRDGLMIGFVGVWYSLTGDRLTTYRKQIALLKDAGCNAIITVMHAGNEHTLQVTSTQRNIAKTAAASGSCLVVGHHPHEPQGYELVSGIPVAYSLGNCVFGGNSRPKDTDALVLQVKLHFVQGELISQKLHFYPIAFSSRKGSNDYCPVLLKGGQANRVLEKMRKSTGVTMPAMTKQGSVITVRMKR